MFLIEFPFTIEEIRGNPESCKRFKGMWAFEFEDVTLISDPKNLVPYRWSNVRDASQVLGDLVRKERI